MALPHSPVTRCDGEFEFLFYDIRGEITPADHQMACNVRVSLRSLRAGLDTVIFMLHTHLRVQDVSPSDEAASYQQLEDGRLEIRLAEPLGMHDEVVLDISYEGELTGIEAYVGEEGLFCRALGQWYPCCTVGPSSTDIPDVPYVMQMCAPAGWTLFAHPDHPEIAVEDEMVVYRWDGRQPHQRRNPGWGISLFGGKYHTVGRNIGENHVTFFTLDPESGRAEQFGDLLEKLWRWLDDYSGIENMPRHRRFAEMPSFLSPSYWPEHTQFYQTCSLAFPCALIWGLLADELSGWQSDSEGGRDLLSFQLASHLYQMFWADQSETPEGWLKAELELRQRGYLGIIQSNYRTLNVHNSTLLGTRPYWSWWLWHQVAGDEAFRRAVRRLAKGVFPEGTVLGVEEFFHLVGDEAGIPADWFVRQWVYQVSAPQLRCRDVSVVEKNGHYRVEVNVHQPADCYSIPLEVVLRTDTGEIRQSIFLRDRDYPLVFECPDRPLELELDPDQKMLKLPSGAKFTPVETGFHALRGRQHAADVMISHPHLEKGKRLIVAPPELMEVAEQLRPSLEKRGRMSGSVPGSLGEGADQMPLVPVQICTPDKATDELLCDNNLVLLGTPRTNSVIREWGLKQATFSPNQIVSGEVTLGDPEQGIILLGAHPQNEDRFCMLVMGLTNDALRHPPDFTEMPGDYLIYSEGRALKVGYQRPYRWKYQLRARR